MNSQTLKQNAIYIAIATLVFAILWLITPTVEFEPTGIILPATRQPLIPSMGPVRVYQGMPFNAKALAYINLEMHGLTPTSDQERKIFAAAIRMAQQAGGKGLVVNVFGFEGENASSPAPLAHYVLNATVIK